MKKLLFILLFASLVFAQDDDDHSDAFGNFVDGISGHITSQGKDFVDTSKGVGTTAASTATTVFEAFGPGSCGDTWLNADSIIGYWLVPAFLVGMIIVFAIAMIYMVAQLFNSQPLTTLAKEEAFQTALTFLRVLIIVILVMGGEAWYSFSAAETDDPIYSNPSNEYMIDSAMAFARQMVADMTQHYSTLLLYNMVIHTIYSSTMWFGVTWRTMYSFNLGPVLKPLIDIIGSALQFLSIGLSSWLLHIVTLCLIKKWTWGLFIPISMLLRAFPLTRNGGEALFALALSLAIFYPFMFIFDYEVHKIMQNNIVDAQHALSTFIHSSGIFSVLGPVVVIVFLTAGVFMPFFLGGALGLALELIRGAVYYIVIISLLLPFINIFVTLTSAKETAAFFHVDVNFMSFLKII